MRSTFARCASLATAGLLTATGLVAGVSPAVGTTSEHHGDQLVVTKTVMTTATKTFHWAIQKSGDKKVFVKQGHKAAVGYKVAVGVKSVTKTYAVAGKISVTNPSHKHAVKVLTVSDVVSPNIAAKVSCPAALPTKLGPGKTLLCSYSAALPNKMDRFNKAIVTTRHDTFKAIMPVKFGPPRLVDTSVFVKDSLAGFLGVVSVKHQPKTFSYALRLGPFFKPGAHRITNVASFVTNDTHTKGSAAWTVKVIVLPSHHHDMH